jgi:ribulose-phosphate 3-epimerase
MKVSASLHAANPLRLSEAVAAVAPHVGSFHVDVMDGRFAPAFGCGESLISRLIAAGAPPVDVHLMIEEPQRWARRFAGLGARCVIFHAEAVSDPLAVADDIRAEGSLAYIALLPETPIARYAALLEQVDGLLLLTAPPGGGEFNKAALARSHEAPKGLPLIVDGGLEPRHFDSLRSCSVELAVVGKALFGSRDLGDRAKRLDLLASGVAASTS